MKAEFTTKIKYSGHSNCIFVPKVQMDILGVKRGEVVKVVLEKVPDPKEGQGISDDDL